MSTDVLNDFLANRSADEKNALLVRLLRDLIQQSPRQPVSIQDGSGKTVGLFSPLESLEDDFFVESSPAFFRELDRRRLDPENVISVDEFLRSVQPEGE